MWSSSEPGRPGSCSATSSWTSGSTASSWSGPGVPAGGDVYVLSRVLHDWDDDRCREILRHCARAMHESADLLVVERVLPADGSASPATAWDLHMMCNVGGRERRADHYARLFADAGLTLVGRTPLPLDGSVLHSRRTGPADTAPGFRVYRPAGSSTRLNEPAYEVGSFSRRATAVSCR